MSYAALNARANHVAHRLCSLGAGPETIIGLHLPRTPEMVASLLRILKAGAAYLPLDPAYPPARTAQTLEDARPPLVLAHPSTPGPAHAGETLFLGDLGGVAVDDPAPLASAENLAYVIYTSGSTGRPRGWVLAPLWAEVLGIAPVRAADGFFALGGHSLRVPRLPRRVEEETGVRLSGAQVFENPTLREMSRRVNEARDAEPLRRLAWLESMMENEAAALLTESISAAHGGASVTVRRRGPTFLPGRSGGGSWLVPSAPPCPSTPDELGGGRPDQRARCSKNCGKCVRLRASLPCGRGPAGRPADRPVLPSLPHADS